VKPNPFPGTLRSPCISVCRMDPDTGYCAGCHRTIDEIADWGMMSDERKRSVWQQIRLRRGVPDPTLPPGALEPRQATMPPQHDGTPGPPPPQHGVRPGPVLAGAQDVLPAPSRSTPPALTPALTPAPGDERS